MLDATLHHAQSDHADAMTGPTPLPGAAPPGTLTAAGLQSRATLLWRRIAFAGLMLASLGVLAFGVTRVLGAGGWHAAEVVVLVCVLIGAPWTLMGFLNAVIGLWVLHGPKGLRAACPVIDEGFGDEPVTARVALTMFLRNEDPRRALDRLAALREGLDATGQGHAFDVFVLSDTSDPDIAEAELAAFSAYRSRLGASARYRRRSRNEGWKAGNIRDFLRRWGGDYTFFLPLDSDSLMSGAAVLRLVRIMQRHPRIGILQALTVGTPADSLFARIFQFGMRHGMRSHTAGAIWWHGDACAYWGHNALIRVAPFRARCRLPVIAGRPPLGGHILSHDQIEAALMRRAGYECRILPVETESFEDNPPTLPDFIKRDHRWCNGNMQYGPLLGLKGLVPMSRFQIFAAMAMYFGGPAWMLMTLAAASMVLSGAGGGVDRTLGIILFMVMFSMSLAPKIAGWIDVALTRGGMARYGGSGRFAVGALVETVFSMMLAPIAALAVTVFQIGLGFGRTVVWSGQQRDLSRVSWGQASRMMWPQTLFGLVLASLLALQAPGALPWAAPVLAGLLLAVPFTVLTASPALGRWGRRVGLCAVPEDFEPPAVMRAALDPARPREALAA